MVTNGKIKRILTDEERSILDEMYYLNSLEAYMWR